MKNLIMFGLVAFTCNGVFADIAPKQWTDEQIAASSKANTRPKDAKSCMEYSNKAEPGRKATWKKTHDMGETEWCVCDAHHGWDDVKKECKTAEEAPGQLK